jgi:hypothetical protein
MVTHNDIGSQKEPFPSSAKFKAFKNDIPVSLSAENINPARNGKCQEMSGILIPDFISSGKCVALRNPAKFFWQFGGII